MIVSSKGIILKIFPYSNTSIICNVFTETYGKITLISKGVRKPKNPLLSILQPFHLLELTFYYKKNRSMHIIKEADIINEFSHIREDFSSIVFGSAINNIINKIFEEDFPNEVIFRLCSKSLDSLSKNIRNNKVIFVFFIYHLSKQLGFMPSSKSCNSCNQKFINDAIFSSSLNALICDQCIIHQSMDLDFVVKHSTLDKIDLINKTYINKIFATDLSNQNLSELFNFLIAFMNSNINHMLKVNSIKEVTKFYHEKK
ncbi:MAG: DNA repair protein RecO [Pelagibacteraceae bacterium TMED246]|nr:MAG: DNA repair protein RecO [Pelagibacteraceae bacterium TMED246]